MGEKAKVKETVQLYSKVWQLPTFRRIIFNLIISVSVLSVVLSLFRSMKNTFDIFTPTFLAYALLYTASMLFGTLLMYAVVRKEDSPLDARRTAGASQFGVLFWVILGGIGGLLDFVLVLEHFENRMLMLGLSVAYVFFAFLLTGLSDHHPIRTFFAAMIPPLLWYSLMFILPQYTFIPFLPQQWILIGMGSIIAFTIAVHYIFNAVSVPFERDLGINGPELLRAFGYDYLMENPEPFEHLIRQIGSKQDIPIDAMIFKNDDGLAAVGVVLYIHPGPFRDLGSSGLPFAIMNHIQEKYEIPSFVLHGTCTHHQNLTDKLDYPRVMAEIDRLITNTPVHDDITGPMWIDRGKFKVWAIHSHRNALLISTSAPEFTDDIALEVGERTKKKITNEYDVIDRITIADAHNCIADDAVSVMPDDPEAMIYTDVLTQSVRESIDCQKHSFMMGIGSFVPNNISQKQGLGPGGITTTIIETPDGKTVFTVVDGNNVEPGFREKVIESVKAMGYDSADIFTTDTHLVNAISLSSKGYPPVGRYCPDEIIDSIEKTVEIAEKNKTRMKMGIGFSEVKDLCTFGERGFDILTQDIVEAAGIAKRNGIVAAGSAFLISLILSFFI